MLRFFEASGAVRRAISVVKKRAGYHENTIREMQMSSQGIKVSKPLVNFHGVLTGVPTYGSREAPLLEEQDEDV
jgi:circadian clock protein KaiC